MKCLIQKYCVCVFLYLYNIYRKKKKQKNTIKTTRIFKFKINYYRNKTNFKPTKIQKQSNIYVNQTNTYIYDCFSFLESVLGSNIMQPYSSHFYFLIFQISLFTIIFSFIRIFRVESEKKTQTHLITIKKNISCSCVEFDNERSFSALAPREKPERTASATGAGVEKRFVLRNFSKNVIRS